MYSTYNNLNSNFTSAVTNNLIYDNASLKALSVGDAINRRDQTISVVDNSKELLSGRQGIVISSDNVKFVASAKVLPKHLSVGDLQTTVEFLGKTAGWVKAKSMYVEFTTSLSGQTARLDQVFSSQDTFQASKCIQAPYCFLNELQDFEGGLGSDTRDLYLDKTLTRNICATKAIMCLKPRTSEQHAALKYLGLPCAKSNLFQDFEDPYLGTAYDNLFIDLLAANKSTKDADVTENLQFSNYEYKFMVFLAELFPFLDSDEWLPPDTTFFFNFKFMNGYQYWEQPGNQIRFNAYNDLFTTFKTTTVQTETPLIIRKNANMIYYDYYSLNPDLERMYSNLPPVIRNAWGYVIHEFYDVKNNKNGNLYNFVLNNTQIPTSIIFYVKTQLEFASIQPGEPNINMRFSEKESFMCGLNYDSFKISSGAETYVYADELNVENRFTVIDTDATAFTNFNNNESLFSYLFDLNRQKQIQNPMEYIPCSTKFNQQDNVIPIEFVLQQQEVQSPDQRSLPMGSSTIDISFSLKGQYYYRDATYELDKPPYLITNSLPPNCTVVFICKYSTQLIHDKDHVYSRIAPPFIARSVDSIKRVEDVHTN